MRPEAQLVKLWGFGVRQNILAKVVVQGDHYCGDHGEKRTEQNQAPHYDHEPGAILVTPTAKNIDKASDDYCNKDAFEYSVDVGCESVDPIDVFFLFCCRAKVFYHSYDLFNK